MPTTYGNVWSRVLCALLCLMNSVLWAKSLDKLDAIASQAKSLEEFLSRPELLRQYQDELREYSGRDRYGCESFDSIIGELKRVVWNVPELGDVLWARRPSGSSLTLVESDSLSASDAKDTLYRFRPLPRKFHAIWLDISRASCGVDDCTETLVSSPSRWALVVESTVVTLLEKNGKMTGDAIALLAVTKDEAKYRLISVVNSGLLTQTGFFGEKGGTRFVSESLYDVWLRRMSAGVSVPKLVEMHFSVSSPSVASLNAVTALGQPGTFVGFLSDFSSGDPLMGHLSMVVNRKCSREGVDSKINLWGGLAPGGRDLSAYQKPGVPVTLNFNDPNVVLGLLDGIKSTANVQPLEFIPVEQMPGLAKALSKVLKGAPDSLLREKAAIGLSWLEGRLSTMKSGARDPASARDLSISAPALVLAGDQSRQEAVSALRSALNDSEVSVRDFAAIALARMGERSAEVTHQLGDSIVRSEPFSTPGNRRNPEAARSVLSAAERAAIAADSKTRNGISLSVLEVKSLVDRWAETSDSREKRLLTQAYSNWYHMASSPDPSKKSKWVVDSLSEWSERDPQVVEAFALACDRLTCNAPKFVDEVAP